MSCETFSGESVMMTADEVRSWCEREREMSREKGLSESFIKDRLKTVMILEAVLQDD